MNNSIGIRALLLWMALFSFSIPSHQSIHALASVSFSSLINLHHILSDFYYRLMLFELIAGAICLYLGINYALYLGGILTIGHLAIPWLPTSALLNAFLFGPILIFIAILSHHCTNASNTALKHTAFFMSVSTLALGLGQIDFPAFEQAYWHLAMIFGVILNLCFLPAEKKPASNTVAKSHPIALTLCLLYAGLLFLPANVFAKAWGQHFLSNTYGFGNIVVENLTHVLIIGLCLGFPLMVHWVRSQNTYFYPMIFSSLANSALLALLIYGPLFPTPILALLLFLLGIFSSASFLAFPIAMEFSPTGWQPFYFSIIQAGKSLVGLALLSFIAHVLDTHWDGHLSITLQPIYSHFEYQFAMGILPLITLLGTVFVYLLKLISFAQLPTLPDE